MDAVLREKLFVLEPWIVKITPQLKALLPTKLFDLLSSALGANTSMTGWSGHEPEAAEPGADQPSKAESPSPGSRDIERSASK